MQTHKPIYCTAKHFSKTINCTTFKAIHPVFVCHHIHNINPHFEDRFYFHLQDMNSILLCLATRQSHCHYLIPQTGATRQCHYHNLTLYIAATRQCHSHILNIYLAAQWVWIYFLPHRSNLIKLPKYHSVLNLLIRRFKYSYIIHVSAKSNNNNILLFLSSSFLSSSSPPAFMTRCIVS